MLVLFLLKGAVIMKMEVKLAHKSYDIVIERGILQHVNDYINLNRNVMIISDDGVPQVYIDMIKKQGNKMFTHIVKQGEDSKSLHVFEEICTHLLELNFSRKDLIIALGGGVIGDLAGFVASTYMRGIPFVNIPTTSLSQIDSSIGGKVAVNLEHKKNILGSFYHPDIVLIDFETLTSLPHRHYINGLVEALKAGLIYDPTLYELFEKDNIDQNLEDIIIRSLEVKKEVVQFDEKEQHLRKILNFGHTIGHGLESAYGLHYLLHGEAVALGMLYFIEDDHLMKRTQKIYDKLGLRKEITFDYDEVMSYMVNDKKSKGDTISVVVVKELGHAEIEDITFDKLLWILKGRKG